MLRPNFKLCTHHKLRSQTKKTVNFLFDQPITQKQGNNQKRGKQFTKKETINSPFLIDVTTLRVMALWQYLA